MLRSIRAGSFTPVFGRACAAVRSPLGSRRFLSFGGQELAAGAQKDLVVIGSGPGGYTCALEAARLGMKVAVVEKEPTVGGTCLNVGCIPSKALLHSSHIFREAAGARFLKGASGVRFDLPAAMHEKEKAVKGLGAGVESLFKKHDVERITGFGRVAGPHKVLVHPAENCTAGGWWGGSGPAPLHKSPPRAINSWRIVVASGSEVVPLSNVPIDEQQIVSSTGALSLRSVPRNMVVIGAGVIGLELGSVWSRLGTSVQVVEFLPRILPPVDAEIGRVMQKSLEKQNMKFFLSTKVTSARPTASGVDVTVAPAAGGAEGKLHADIVLVAVGRRPATKALGLENAGVKRLRNGEINVFRDSLQARGCKSIYAIGDAVFGPWLAHKAEVEGVAVARRLAGRAMPVDYGAIPAVVYTDPEIASVGATEEELLLRRGRETFVVGRAMAAGNPRAKAIGATQGMVKVLVDKTYGTLLGVHVMGLDASELITAAGYALHARMTVRDVARICHAHPTFSEALHTACHDAINKLPQRAAPFQRGEVGWPTLRLVPPKNHLADVVAKTIARTPLASARAPAGSARAPAASARPPAASARAPGVTHKPTPGRVSTTATLRGPEL